MTAAFAFLACSLGVLGVTAFLPALGRDTRLSAPARHMPALLRACVAVGTAAARKASPDGLEQRIAAAGRPAGLGARELMAARAGGAIFAVLTGTSIGALAPGRLGVLVAAAAPVAGFFAVDLWLARLAARRARAARAELPQLLDLLRATVDAGIALPLALLTVGERADGPLAREWRAVGREVTFGVSLADALAAMARRLPLPEVEALARTFDRTRRHGVPLGESLASQAADARSALTRQIREEAARAGPKIQLVVALLLVPSVLLLVAAALIAALAGSGGTDLAGWS